MDADDLKRVATHARPTGRQPRSDQLKARSSDARKQAGNYPIPGTGHAICPKRLSRLQRGAGNLTKDEFKRINRKADRVLHIKSGQVVSNTGASDACGDYPVVGVVVESTSNPWGPLARTFRGKEVSYDKDSAAGFPQSAGRGEHRRLQQQLQQASIYHARRRSVDDTSFHEVPIISGTSRI